MMTQPVCCKLDSTRLSPLRRDEIIDQYNNEKVKNAQVDFASDLI